jgi:hypothetical protein
MTTYNLVAQAKKPTEYDDEQGNTVLVYDSIVITYDADTAKLIDAAIWAYDNGYHGLTVIANSDKSVNDLFKSSINI